MSSDNMSSDNMSSDNMSDVTAGDLIQLYINLRTEKAAVEAEVKSRVDKIRTQMKTVEAMLLKQLSDQDATSFKTSSGTAYITTTDYTSVQDWDAVLDYVKKNDAYDLLERRVSRMAVRAHIDSQATVPPGVNFSTKMGISVRKPTS